MTRGPPRAGSTPLKNPVSRRINATTPMGLTVRRPGRAEVPGAAA
ncbi:MAG: hypothetical protein ACRDRR_15790 [Pseudonocardiaceae bacterium]